MSVCNRYIERFCKMKPENLFFFFSVHGLSNFTNGISPHALTFVFSPKVLFSHEHFYELSTHVIITIITTT